MTPSLGGQTNEILSLLRRNVCEPCIVQSRSDLYMNSAMVVSHLTMMMFHDCQDMVRDNSNRTCTLPTSESKHHPGHRRHRCRHNRYHRCQHRQHRVEKQCEQMNLRMSPAAGLAASAGSADECDLFTPEIFEPNAMKSHVHY